MGLGWSYQRIINEISNVDFYVELNNVCNQEWEHLGHRDRRDIENTFNTWMNTSDKSGYKDVFFKKGFRELYTWKLFNSRTQLVHDVMAMIWQERNPRELLKNATSYISLGCGPGLCMVGLILFLRNDCGIRCKLSVTGIDIVGDWRPYVEALDGVDTDTTVEFREIHVKENTVCSNLKRADVCLMIFADAAQHTAGFFRELKRRYNLIIILDQRPNGITDTLSSAGFEVLYVEDKSVFYCSSVSYIPPVLYDARRNHTVIPIEQSPTREMGAQEAPGAAQPKRIDDTESCCSLDCCECNFGDCIKCCLSLLCWVIVIVVVILVIVWYYGGL